MTKQDIEAKDKEEEDIRVYKEYIPISAMSDMLALVISTMCLWVFVLIPVIMFILLK